MVGFLRKLKYGVTTAAPESVGGVGAGLFAAALSLGVAVSAPCGAEPAVTVAPLCRATFVRLSKGVTSTRRFAVPSGASLCEGHCWRL